MKNFKEMLPVGSVVLLKGGKKKLMVIGIFQLNEDESKMYDYLGVPYPEGFIGADRNFLFSHEDITDIVFTGYTNPERENMMEVMQILYDKTLAEHDFLKIDPET